MEETLPGYAWAGLGKATKVSIEFTGFTGWKRVINDRRDAESTQLAATFTGNLNANGKIAPITGSATFVVLRKVQTFSLTVTFTADGKDLGLPASQAGPLNFTLKTSSPASSDTPSTGGGDLLEIEGKD